MCSEEFVTTKSVSSSSVTGVCLIVDVCFSALIFIFFGHILSDSIYTGQVEERFVLLLIIVLKCLFNVRLV